MFPRNPGSKRIYPSPLRMVAIALATAMAFAAAVVLVSAVTPAAAQDKQRIAVLELAQQDTPQEAEAIAEELRKILVKSNKYVVIDRTLTTQILKEWETQQSGLTDGDKAVKIGKLFNVQLIVSGKLNRFPSGGWQLSAVMLNAQTGVTIKAETVRHRGDFFSLLDAKVPALGAALAGISDSSAAASGGGAGDSLVRLAIFPALYSGKNSGKVEEKHEQLIRGIRRMMHNNFARRIEITHEFSSVGGIGGEKNDRIINHAWREETQPRAGIRSKPNAEFIFRAAREMGVQLVLIYESTIPGGGRGKHHVYLYDVSKRKELARTTGWKKGAFGKPLAKTIRKLIKRYRDSR